jgi:cation diffusion facilitator CzcD-associated flavoprotein CzcO
MLDTAGDSISAMTARWLTQFERALSAGDWPAVQALFHPECHWRDVLALSWEIQTVSGAGQVVAALKSHIGRARPVGFKIDPERTPPRQVIRAGSDAVEAIFAFETADGRGEGVLRLIPDNDDGAKFKAWTLLTALRQLRGFEERVGTSRPTGGAYSRDFHGPNWLDLRNSAAAYDGREPTVLVVGGGQGGLSIAARLTQLGVDTLIVDRHPRIGDNWRQRYHALTLHNQVHVNHLPYMPFPPNWPAYIPKDKLANWFEAYAESMELNFWTGVEFRGGAYDAEAERWTVELRHSDGTVRQVHPRHIVMSTGVSDIPNLPDIPTLAAYKGTLIHSSAYEDGEAWKGRDALVIGTGNSGHDIAQDLYSSGARVTLVQRSPTQIVNVEPSAQLPYALYDEGPPLEDCDLITASMPLAVARKSHILLTTRAKEIDKQLLDRLTRVGFKLDYGEDGSGWQFKYLSRGGGYYFNVGCSDLVADGKIKLVQYTDIAEFTAAGAKMKSGDVRGADLIVLATGFKGQEHLVRRLFGDGVADSVGTIWGFGEAQELRNMFQRTQQPGLWFLAGSFAQCRIYSKYLSLQIKACEEGLIPLTA